MDDIIKSMKRWNKRFTLDNNKFKGKWAEESFKTEMQVKGYDVERTGHGSDYKARKRNLLTGKVGKEKHYEVKSGNAKLSPLQRKKKRKLKSDFIEWRF